MEQARDRLLADPDRRVLRFPEVPHLGQPDPDHRAVRAVAGPDPRLRTHHFAGPGRVLRARRVHRRLAGQVRLGRTAERPGARRARCVARRARDELSRGARPGPYPADVTLGIGLMFYEAANQATSITGGVDGLSGVVMGKLFGVFSFGMDGRTAYVYSLVVLFIVFCCARTLVRSPFGLSLRGIREGEKRMPAIGASVPRKLVAVYTIGAGIAGIAGALLAQTTQFVGIDSLGFPRSADLMIMLVLGGTGYLYGGIIGAAVFMLMQDYLSNLNPVYWQFWLGLLLVIIVLFARGGLLGGLIALRQKFSRARE